MTDTIGTLTISDIVREYNVTHGQLYRAIRKGAIPADAITREKYKGRQGWRSLIKRDALDALSLAPRTAIVAEAATGK
jgi:hypothetical protein